jgi:hypothetical protein
VSRPSALRSRRTGPSARERGRPGASASRQRGTSSGRPSGPAVGCIHLPKLLQGRWDGLRHSMRRRDHVGRRGLRSARGHRLRRGHHMRRELRVSCTRNDDLHGRRCDEHDVDDQRRIQHDVDDGAAGDHDDVPVVQLWRWNLPIGRAPGRLYGGLPDSASGDLSRGTAGLWFWELGKRRAVRSTAILGVRVSGEFVLDGIRGCHDDRRACGPAAGMWRAGCRGCARRGRLRAGDQRTECGAERAPGMLGPRHPNVRRAVGVLRIRLQRVPDGLGLRADRAQEPAARDRKPQGLRMDRPLYGRGTVWAGCVHRRVRGLLDVPRGLWRLHARLSLT